MRVCGPWAITHFLSRLKLLHLTGFSLLLVFNLSDCVTTSQADHWHFSFFPTPCCWSYILGRHRRESWAPFYHPVPTLRVKLYSRNYEARTQGSDYPHPILLLGWRFQGRDKPWRLGNTLHSLHKLLVIKQV